MTRPNSRDVARRLLAYLFRTGSFDWAGGREAEYEKRWGKFAGSPAFDFLAGFDGLKSAEVMFAPGFHTSSAPRELKSGAVFEIKAIRVSIPFGMPEPPKFGPDLPPRPSGFFPLVAHNFSIGYDGDIQHCREEAERDGDTEAVAICDLLLQMKRTARDKCGYIVDEELSKRGLV